MLFVLDVITIAALVWASTVITYNGRESIPTGIIKSTFILLAIGQAIRSASDNGYLMVAS